MTTCVSKVVESHMGEAGMCAIPLVTLGWARCRTEGALGEREGGGSRHPLEHLHEGGVPETAVVRLAPPMGWRVGLRHIGGVLYDEVRASASELESETGGDAEEGVALVELLLLLLPEVRHAVGMLMRVQLGGPAV